MICSNCSEIFDDKIEICPKCGAHVNEGSFEPLPVKKSKKMRKGIVITIVTLLILGCVSASGYFFARTQITMLVLSPKSYYMMLEARGVKDLKSNFSNQIYNTKDIINRSGSIAIDASGINSLPAEIKSVINNFNITINSDIDTAKSIVNTSFGIKYKDEEMLKAVLAQNKEKMGLSLPLVNSTYYTDTNQMYETAQANSIDEMIQNYTGLSKKDTDEMLTKYAKEVYFSSINDKNVKYLDSKDIDGKNCKGIEISFDSAFMKQFTESLAKTLKDDIKLKTAIYEAYKKQSEQLPDSEKMSQSDFDKSYMEFVNSIKYDESTDGKESAVMTVWFDKSENIISRQFTAYTDGKEVSDILFNNNKNGSKYIGSIKIETPSQAGTTAVNFNYSFEKVKTLTGVIPVGTFNIDISDQAFNAKIKAEISKQDSGNYKISVKIDSGAIGSITLNCTYSEKKIDSVIPVEFTESNSKPMSEMANDGVLEKLQMSLMEKAQKNGLINIFYGLMGAPSPDLMGIPSPDGIPTF